MSFVNKINNIISFIIFLFLEKFLKKEKTSEGENVLFVNLGLLGDVVLSTPIFANEDALLKKGRIYFLIDVKWKDLFGAYGGKVKILFVDKKKYRFNLLYRIKFLKTLKSKNFREVYNLSFTRISIDDEISLIAARGSKSFAFENNPKLERVFDKRFEKRYSVVVKRAAGSDLENIAKILEKFSRESILRETLVFHEKKKDSGLSLGNYFVVAPFASLRIKEWKIENYKKLIDMLTSEFGMQAVVLHSEKRSDFNEINNVINLSGRTTLAEASSVIAGARFFIGNDTGLLHLAKALKKKIFGIVGGGVWGRIYPYSEKDNATYFYKELDCFNCDWKCKYDFAECLQEVEAERVYFEIKNYLQANE
jgi:ADP-heptose:LPS heptosyltransferase